MEWWRWRERIGLACFFGGLLLGFVLFFVFGLPDTGPDAVWPVASVLALLVAGVLLLND